MYGEGGRAGGLSEPGRRGGERGEGVAAEWDGVCVVCGYCVGGDLVIYLVIDWVSYWVWWGTGLYNRIRSI